MGFYKEIELTGYLKFQTDGIDVYLSPKIKAKEGENITIYLEKLWFFRKLEVTGVDCLLS